MQIVKNKIAAIVIAIFLTLSIGASIMLIPTASAHNPPITIPTYAYISASPNPVGVGQQVTIYMWLNQVFGYYAAAGATTTADYAQVTNNYRFQNYNLTIIAPDGTTNSTIFSYIADPTSDQYLLYTPTQTGTYQLIFTFPGQAYNQTTPGGSGTYDPASVLIGDTYAPSSANTTMTVQQAPIPAATGSSPLPTQYWTYPIYGENTYWYTISSNWLGSGSPVSSATGYGGLSFATAYPTSSAIQAYPGDAVGPLTSHVMWTYPVEEGGVVGGNEFTSGGSYPGNPQGVGYFEGSAYNNRYINPIILDGNIYYTEPVTLTGPSSGPTVCQSLQTGQIIWSSTQIPALSFGYIYNVWSVDQHGVYPAILFTANFARAFDAFTGDPLFNVTGVPSGTIAQGPSGEQLRYVLTNDGTTASPAYYLGEWNSSRLWETVENPWSLAVVDNPTLYNDSTSSGAALTTGQSQEANVTEPALGAVAGNNNNEPATSNYVVYGNVVNVSNALYSYDWNVSTPALNTMTTAPTILAALAGNVLLCKNGTYPVATATSVTGAFSSTPYTYFAVNLNATRGPIGEILWWNTITPSGTVSVSFGGVNPTVNVFVEAYRETTQFVGYSLTTGQEIWGPTAPQAAFDYYGSPGAGTIVSQLAYGKLYSSAFAGILYCYDLTNGNLLWTYGNGGEGNSTNAGLNTPYGDYPTFINAVGNGVIYTVTTEHTIIDPIYKGALARAINATTGAEIWTLSDYTGEFTQTSYAIANGYATFFNGYDDQVYSVGQGPSATTVTAPQTAVTAGANVVIQGTVMDISAGTQQTQQKADFPNGVPCASDASMSAWMSYVYQQQPMPTNFTGVTVSIDATDPNGNFVHLGDATTDAKGLFTFTWTPPSVPGSYLVTATFAGTNGYWGSSAETGMTVQNAAATPAPTATPASNLATSSELTLGIAAAVIAIIIAIAIVGLLLLRKKP